MNIFVYLRINNYQNYVPMASLGHCEVSAYLIIIF